MTTLQDYLEQWSTRSPEQTYIIEAETGRSINYRQSLRAVRALQRIFGPRPRSIAMALPGGIATALVWLAALSGGHTLVPLAPDATDSEKAALIRRYAPDLLIVEERQHAVGFVSASAQVLTRQQLLDVIAHAEDEQYMAPSPQTVGQVCLHTSGSTGEPKGVILREPQIVWTAEQIRASHQLGTRDRGLCVLPFFHVNAPVVSLCSSLVAGSTIVIARRFSRQHFWAWIEQYQITWASIVPTIVAILLGTEKPTFLPGSLRFVRTASAPLPAVHLLAFEQKFGIPVIETYGLSEAASQVTANPVPPGIHKPGSVGKPTGVELRICRPLTIGAVQDTLRDVAPGAVGEICVRGPSVIKAYQGNAGRQSFQDGWFRTGDLGYQDADGYVFITGRLREVINRGGENIAPREIEDVLLSHPAVHEAAVVGRPDPFYGEVVVAYVVPQKDAEDDVNAARTAGVAVATRTVSKVALKRGLQQYAAQRLSPPKVPVDILIVDELPRTASGKIARQLLREQERQRG